MTVITALIAVLVFVGLVGGSLMTCGPARIEERMDDEMAACPMRKYVVAFALSAVAVALTLAVVAQG